MLTEFSGQWIDLAEIAQIVETGDTCFIHLKGDRDSIDMNLPAGKLAELVNAATAKKVSVSVTGHVPDLIVPAQVSPNARTFLTPKGVDAISSRVTLATLHHVAGMVESYLENPVAESITDLAECLQLEIKVAEQNQAAMEKPGPPRGRTVLEGREGDETEESKP